MPDLILLRGGGDLASGVALRLHRVGLPVLLTELPQPMVVRRLVSFAEAVYQGEIDVEGITARRIDDLEHAREVLEQGQIPVMIDPELSVLPALKAGALQPYRMRILVDGRMTKRPPDIGKDAADLVIGLGPGFVAGDNCHVVIETNRGHHLGRAIWSGAPEADTGIPEIVAAHQADRVLRAPHDGRLQAFIHIGDHLEAGQPVAQVDDAMVCAPFRGVLRGILHSGIMVRKGTKIGDIDPRDDPRYCTLVSDKSLAIGGGVLEAILSLPALRKDLWR